MVGIRSDLKRQNVTDVPAAVFPEPWSGCVPLEALVDKVAEADFRMLPDESTGARDRPNVEAAYKKVPHLEIQI